MLSLKSWCERDLVWYLTNIRFGVGRMIRTLAPLIPDQKKTSAGGSTMPLWGGACTATFQKAKRFCCIVVLSLLLPVFVQARHVVVLVWPNATNVSGSDHPRLAACPASVYERHSNISNKLINILYLLA